MHLYARCAHKAAKRISDLFMPPQFLQPHANSFGGLHACAMQFILISVFAQVPCYSAVSLQVNVYWLTVDHDIKSHVSEVIRPLLKLASQEECEMMWR